MTPDAIVSTPSPVRTGRLAGVGLRSANEVAKAPRGNSTSTQVRRPRGAQIPNEILHDAELNSDIAHLPSNYSFQVHRTIWRLRCANAQRVGLQMPEGLIRYASMLSDIFRRHARAETVVLGDVTYGACCVDDLSAQALGCDFLVHYGHSCLVPVTQCTMPMMYVFVTISFEPSHLVACLKDNFEPSTRVALVGTIQFIDVLHTIRPKLEEYFTDISVPRARPLTPGELLGCTAPKITERDVLVYVGDGRFHLESAMIANPDLPAYRYDPYSKSFTVEKYDQNAMLAARRGAIETAHKAKFFGVVLGTLGRQGSPAILKRLQNALREEGRAHVVILLSEITPAKLELLEKSGIDAWIQIACPRLSIDWGTSVTSKPLLTPYEAFVALGKVQWKEDDYPMDFYAKGSGPWTNYHKEEATKREPKPSPQCAVNNKDETKTSCECSKT